MSESTLRSCFLFEDLPDEICAQIQQMLPPPFSFQKEHVIDVPAQRGLILLVHGRARVVHQSENQVERLVKFLEPGQLFGAAGLFGDQKSSSTVVAMSNGQAWFLPEEILLRIWEQYPQTAQRYIRFLTERVRFLNRRIAALAEPSAQDRLWHYLLQHCREDGTVQLDRSMTALAKTLGIGRASLYRVLDAMQERGQLSHKDHSICIERKYIL